MYLIQQKIWGKIEEFLPKQSQPNFEHTQALFGQK